MYLVSIKLDGKFVRVIKRGSLIRMLTSGDKDFYHNDLAEKMKDFPDGQYNMELVHGRGLLKSRVNTGYLTTAYTLYSKKDPKAGDWEGQDDLGFVIFDYLPNSSHQMELIYKTYLGRFRILTDHVYRSSPTVFKAVVGKPCNCGNRCNLLSVVKQAHTLNPNQERLRVVMKQLDFDSELHEGLVFRNTGSYYVIPVNYDDFKVKIVKEAVGEVVGVEMDKNQGNGTLILKVDTNGTDIPSYCRVSSGINGDIREAKSKSLIGKIVEFEYESITADGAYNLPRIKRFDV